MSNLSARLALPYLQPSQAQKHITHNEALERLDILVQLTVEEFGATAPPSLPEAGAVHALGTGATGAWAGHDGELAAWVDDVWHFIAPQEGWRAWGRNEGELRVWDGSAWLRAGTGTLDLLGINATADVTNRLAVAAPATLFTHEGGDHRLKIDKAAAGDTASLLFQTGFSGRAEMGTAGSDDFAVRVSADGSAWTTAMALEAATGRAVLRDVEADSFGGAGVTQSSTDTAAGRVILTDHGWTAGNLLGPVSEDGTTPTGAVIERGSNANGGYVRFADGTQICWQVVSMGSITAAGNGSRSNPYRTALQSWTYPAEFASSPALSAIPRVAATNDVRRAVSASYRFTISTGVTDLMVIRNTDDSTDNNAEVDVQATGRWF